MAEEQKKLLASFLSYETFFEEESLGPLHFSTTPIISLFFYRDLIFIETCVFLIDLLILLIDSINRENKEKNKFSRYTQ